MLVSGDEEYRSEEALPMLAKILAKHHGFDCTVLFALDKTKSYIDSNNQAGIVGWESLEKADLMIIATRFRSPSAEDAKYVTDFLNAGKPVIGLRTATHAFRGGGDFGGLSYGQFGRLILGEQWVSHHGGHKREGARGVIEDGKEDHPIIFSNDHGDRMMVMMTNDSNVVDWQTFCFPLQFYTTLFISLVP